MLRVESNTHLEGFTEFEEDILFDQDDPDFNGGVPSLSSVPVIFKVHKKMSFASVYSTDLHSSHSSLTSRTQSADDINEACWNYHLQSEHVLTIEELRLQMTSCFTCGVSWSDNHVSLDCSECGGYALERTCPECEGVCGSLWKRDLSLTHASHKARWEGTCKKEQKTVASNLESQQSSLKPLEKTTNS